MRRPVGGDDGCEVISADHLAKIAKTILDRSFNGHPAGGCALRRFLDEAFQNVPKCSSVQRSASRKAGGKRGVERTRLPAGRVNAPVGREIGLADGGLMLKRDLPDKKQEEGLAGTIGAADETDARTAVADPIYILD